MKGRDLAGSEGARLQPRRFGPQKKLGALAPERTGHLLASRLVGSNLGASHSLAQTQAARTTDVLRRSHADRR